MRALLLAIALCLAGCASLPVETGADPSPVREWQPPGLPRAQIVAVHGFNDYKGAFDGFGAFAAQHGVALIAYDQPGFGEHDARGLWPGADALTAALRERLEQVRLQHPQVPLFVLGESMGAAVVTLTMSRADAPQVDGIILVAPAVWGGDTLNPLYRLVLAVANGVVPGMALTGRGLGILASDNLEMLRALGRDPLVIKSTRVDALAGLVLVMDQARVAAPRLPGHVLVLTGARDEVVPPATQSSFAAMIGAEDCRFVRYPQGWHMLLRDLDRAVVWQDLLAWTQAEVLPSGPTTACAGQSVAPAPTVSVYDWRSPGAVLADRAWTGAPVRNN